MATKQYKATRHWDNWLDFVRDAQLPGADNADRQSQKEPSNNWDNDAGWQGAVDLANFGWKEGRDRFIKGVAFAPSIVDLGAAPTRAHGVVGYRPNIGRLMAGSPACMVRRGVDLTGGRPIVRLLIGVASSGNVRSSIIENRGIAICSCVDQLESLGYQFEIVAHDGSALGQVRSDHTVVLKHAGESLDVDRISFALAHPAYARRLCFRILEQDTNLWPALSGGYGGVCDPTPEPGQILFPSLHAREARYYQDIDK
ncbi:MAG: hypothetical protein V3S12_00910, partial [Acidiferrobacterales bacterium]